MIFEWLMLAKNLGSGPARPTAFYVVHAILVCVNIVLAIVLAAIGWRAWHSSDPQRADTAGTEREG